MPDTRPVAVDLAASMQEAAADAASLEEALRAAISRICAHTGWKAGRVEFAAEAGELSSRIVWHLDAPAQLGSFRKLAEARRLKGGDLLVERVLREGVPGYEPTGGHDGAAGTGIAATYAFPLQVRGDTIAALEFFSAESGAPDAALVSGIMDGVGRLAALLERKPAEDALWRAASYRELFESAGEALFVIDPGSACIIEVNPRACELYERARDRLLGAHVSELWDGAPDLSRPGEAGRFEVAARTRAGRPLPRLEVTVSDVLYRGQRALLALSREPTQPARTVAALRQSEEHYRLLFEDNPQPMWVHDLGTSGFLAVNKAALRSYGFTRQQFLAMTVDDLRAPPEPGRTVEAIPVEPQRGSVVRRHRNSSGEVRDVELSSHDIQFEGRRARLVSATNVTTRRKAQARLLQAAFYDPLTGLPNRALFRDRLEVAFSRARGREQARFVVLFLDVDRFKLVNDGLGHRAGDELLTQIGRRLDSCRRAGDTVARLGGDEFTLLVEGIADEREAASVAERVHRALAAPFLVDGHEVFASVSIGIALGGPDTESPEHPLRDADTAMYRAKLRGARYVLFDASMHERAMAALRLENELRRALEDGDFRVHYQPIVELASGKLRGLEALVRWQHKERGIICPGEFIPLAEETGLIVRLGRWVLEEACRQAAAQLPAPLLLSVNLSGRQLLQPELIDHVRGALAGSGLDPRRLRLELTESMLIDNGAAAMDRLEELRRLEVTLCIDDFGTGYSSLSYLHQLPIAGLKIDLSFVRAMVTDQRKIKIVQTILMLGKGLGIEVVAEGVETEEQAQLLRSLGCEFAQGYLFARPMPLEDLLPLIARQ